MADVRMCGFERRTSVERALELLRARVVRLPSEAVPVEDAVGRVAAEDVLAATNVPHFVRSMMDGYAVIAESTMGATSTQPRSLDVIGEVRAGAMPSTTVGVGQAIRITTGAPLPEGANAVLMAELTELSGERVLATQSVSPGKHVAPIGEDIEAGTRVLAEGRVLRAQDAGVLASVGLSDVRVIKRPRVRVLITGNELLPPGSTPSGAQIVDSNSVVLRALAERDGAASIDVVRERDDESAIALVMQRGDVDVLLVSGGSSVGPEDHAPKQLESLGDVVVHGVAMRPSSPAGFGFIERRLVVLLPGNPVSCMCAYEFFGGPAIRALGGRPWAWPHRQVTMNVAEKMVSVLGRTDFMRVTIDDGSVFPLMTSGASILSSTTRADGVVIIPDEYEGHAEGDRVEVLLF
jgi:molybdopterin molybdotransferase